MVITYIGGEGLVLTAQDSTAARAEAERWLRDSGMPPIQVAQLDVPRAQLRDAWWTGAELVELEQPGAQAVTVVDVPDPTP